jgi:hypothetical protein
MLAYSSEFVKRQEVPQSGRPGWTTADFAQNVIPGFLENGAYAGRARISPA